jgi:hypothetical protein
VKSRDAAENKIQEGKIVLWEEAMIILHSVLDYTIVDTP